LSERELFFSYQSSCGDHPVQFKQTVQRHWWPHPGQRPRVL